MYTASRPSTPTGKCRVLSVETRVRNAERRVPLLPASTRAAAAAAAAAKPAETAAATTAAKPAESTECAKGADAARPAAPRPAPVASADPRRAAAESAEYSSDDGDDDENNDDRRQAQTLRSIGSVGRRHVAERDAASVRDLLNHTRRAVDQARAVGAAAELRQHVLPDRLSAESVRQELLEVVSHFDAHASIRPGEHDEHAVVDFLLAGSGFFEQLDGIFLNRRIGGDVVDGDNDDGVLLRRAGEQRANAPIEERGLVGAQDVSEIVDRPRQRRQRLCRQRPRRERDQARDEENGGEQPVHQACHASTKLQSRSAAPT